MFGVAGLHFDTERTFGTFSGANLSRNTWLEVGAQRENDIENKQKEHMRSYKFMLLPKP